MSEQQLTPFETCESLGDNTAQIKIIASLVQSSVESLVKSSIESSVESSVESVRIQVII